MRKTLVVGTVAVFVLWTVLDFIIHGVLLMPTYAATASLWRPMEDMNQGLLSLTTIVAAVCFTLIYAEGFAGGPLPRSLRYGLYFGIGAGMSMGFGTYAVMPIPGTLAMSWLLATVVEALAAAWLLHWVYGRYGTSGAGG